jgi:hypothetical protein
MFFCCVCLCCQVEVSATSWSLVQRSPTDCGASLYVIKKPRKQGGRSPRWATEPKKIINKWKMYKMRSPRVNTTPFLYIGNAVSVKRRLT